MNWHILGAGAQGLLWASALSQTGNTATLLVRPEADEGPRPLTLERDGNEQTLTIARVRSDRANQLSQLLVTVKAPDLADALSALTPSYDQLRLVVLLQNGLGAEAIARRLLPETTVIWLGTSTHGSFRRSPNHVVHAGQGAIWLGPGRGHLRDAEQAAALASLQATALNVGWDDAIQGRLWQKLLVNACLNPLTALLDCRNGELLSHPLARQWLPLLAAEAAAVASAEGWPTEPAALLTRVDALATATAGNFNSMQQDFKHQRPTEIAFITGALINAAARHGLALPHHCELLERIEQRRPFADSAAESFVNPVSKQS